MKNKKFRLILGASLIVVLAALITTTIICYNSCQNKEYVTISFETGEGSNVDDIRVEKGSKVAELPTPSMAGATFENWYYDTDYVTTFNYDQEINEDLTLYADYLISVNDLLVNENTEHYEENCEKTKEVTVIARRGLSKEQFLNNI